MFKDWSSDGMSVIDRALWEIIDGASIIEGEIINGTAIYNTRGNYRYEKGGHP